MNAQSIFLVQSVTAAVIEIILLLLGAALIGFLTAWYYQKSVYTPVIKKLESEKDDLIRQVAILKNEKDELIKKVAVLNDEKGQLKDKILTLEKSLAARKEK
jgi:cell division protein FtsB